MGAMKNKALISLQQLQL